MSSLPLFCTLTVYWCSEELPYGWFGYAHGVPKGVRGAFLMLPLNIQVCVSLSLICWFLFAFPYMSPSTGAYTWKGICTSWLKQCFSDKNNNRYYLSSIRQKALPLAPYIRYFIYPFQYHFRGVLLALFYEWVAGGLRRLNTLPFILEWTFLQQAEVLKDNMVPWFSSVNLWTGYIWDLEIQWTVFPSRRFRSMGLGWCLRGTEQSHQQLWCCRCNCKFGIHYF